MKLAIVGIPADTFRRWLTPRLASRCLKTVDLQVRPIFHRTAARVRAHVLLCTLAYYVEFHMRKALKPLLFADERPEEAAASRESPVAAVQVSKSAKKMAQERVNSDGEPVQNFRGLLASLSALTRVQVKLGTLVEFDRDAEPTALQARALQLLGVGLSVRM